MIGWRPGRDRIDPFGSVVDETKRIGDAGLEIVFAADDSVEALLCLDTLRCDAAIVRVTSEAMARAAQQVTCPLVNVSSWFEDPGVPTITFDEEARGSLAADHLLERGLQRFLLVMTDGGWFVEGRAKGFKQQAAACGFEVQTVRLSSLSPTVAEREHLVNALESIEAPLGVFCTDDPIGPAVIEAAASAGRTVPHDVALIAACDRVDICTVHEPSISSVEPGHHALAEHAVKGLQELLRGEWGPDRLRRVRPDRVVARESTDTRAINDPLVARAVVVMRQNLGEPFNVASVVRAVGCSRLTLERRFRAVLDATPGHVLAEIRVNEARRLLVAHRQWTLQQVANAVGFTDRNRFRMAFRRHAGMTPKEYRKQMADRAARVESGPASGAD